jgi:cation transport ATPase
LGSDPLRVLDVMDLSAQTMSAIRQNLFLAFIYNALAIPLAMSGFINPLIAVIAMFASSLTVIGNTLRIVRST